MYSMPQENFFDYSASFLGSPEYSLFVNVLISISFIIHILGVALVLKKANEQWWKALIPYYSLWTQTKVAQAPTSWFWWCAGLVIGATSISVMSFFAFIIALFSFSETPFLFGLMLICTAFAMYIAAGVFYWLILRKLSNRFGKDGWFATGLLLLGEIFWLILAFDKSHYRPDPNSTDATSGAVPSGTFGQAGYLQAHGYQQQGQVHYNYGQPQQHLQRYDAFGRPIVQSQGQQGQYQQTYYSGQAQNQCQHAFGGQQPAQVTGQQFGPQGPINQQERGLSRGAIVGIVCAILVPILACCVWINWLSDVANQTTIGGQPPLF